jgi:hypothetical protein
MTTITLGEMIERLKKLEQDYDVPFYFAKPHSNRGYYERLGVELVTSKYEHGSVQVSNVVKFLEGEIGMTYGSWKGGDYTMGENTIVCISSPGVCGCPITAEFLESYCEMITDSWAL